MRLKTMLAWMCGLALMAAGCKRQRAEEIDWSENIERTDTTPYGTHLAYEAARYYFPDAKIQRLPARFRFTSISNEMRYPDDGNNSLLVSAGFGFPLSTDELEALLTFVRSGNEAVIFCSYMDNALEKKLHIEAIGGSEEMPLNNMYNSGETNRDVLTLRHLAGRRFGYHGRDLTGYFRLDSVSSKSLLAPAAKAPVAPPVFYPDDSVVAEETSEDYSEYDEDYSTDSYEDQGDTAVVPVVLGYSDGKPNFLQYGYGAGHLTVHIAPLVLSNYFLLQGSNRKYLDGLWSTLPQNISSVYWHEYYQRSAESSSLGLLWRHPATRWALLLLLLMLVLYVFFESKRRQRIIPVVKPLENTSVAFVETIGRLYFDRADHANLAGKMVQHFLEWVRNTHNLPTTELDFELGVALARKSGRRQAEAHEAVRLSEQVRSGKAFVSEAYLHQLYTTFHAFYETSRA